MLSCRMVWRLSEILITSAGKNRTKAVIINAIQSDVQNLQWQCRRRQGFAREWSHCSHYTWSPRTYSLGHAVSYYWLVAKASLKMMSRQACSVLRAQTWKQTLKDWLETYTTWAPLHVLYVLDLDMLMLLRIFTYAEYLVTALHHLMVQI